MGCLWANRLISVTDWNSNSTAYAYDDAGRMTTATLPSGTGIVSTYTFDDADRLTNIAHVKGGSTTVASVAYTLDDVGNRTQRVDQQGTHTYAYDDLHRLTSVTYPGPSTTTYDFDGFGNRIEMVTGAGTTDYTYDDADRLTSVDPPAASPIAYTWDDNGNLTDRGADEFLWDYEDRMVEATVNSVTSTFTYRGDGLRDTRTVGGGGAVTFTWDVASGLPVVLDDGAQQYVYGAGLTSMKQGGNWYYYLADGLGSTLAVVDSSGASQKSYQYDVYGEVTGGSGALSQEFDFAGQQTDATGLQYLRARYYDPETGTFMTRDPLSVAPEWTGHPFQYTGARPTNASDPTGLCMLWEDGCIDDITSHAIDKCVDGSVVPSGGQCPVPDKPASFTLDEYAIRFLERNGFYLASIGGKLLLALGLCVVRAAEGGGMCIIRIEDSTTGQVVGAVALTTGLAAAAGAGGISTATEIQSCATGKVSECTTSVINVTLTLIPNFITPVVYDPISGALVVTLDEIME